MQSQTPASSPSVRSLSVLLILPILLLVAQTFSLLRIGGSFGTFIDPDSAYYFASINLDVGNTIRFLQHPGMGLIIFGGAVIWAAKELLYSGPLGPNALLHFNELMQIARFAVVAFACCCAAGAGILIARASRSVMLGLALQGGLISSTFAIIFGARLMPEPFLVGIVLLLAAVTVSAALGEFRSFKLSLAAGALVGIGLATKILFLPVAILYPIAVGFRLKQQATYVVAVVIFSALVLAPAWQELSIFTAYIRSIAGSKGAYGSGAPGFVDVDAAIRTLFTIWHDYWLQIGAAIASFVIVSLPLNPAKRFSIVRVVWGMAAVLLASIAIVSKQYAAYYLVPALALTPVMLGVALGYGLPLRLQGRKVLSGCIAAMLVVLVAMRSYEGVAWLRVVEQTNVNAAIVEKELRKIQSSCVILPSFSVGIFDYPIVFGFVFANRNADQVAFYNRAIRQSFDRHILNYDYFNKQVFLAGDMHDVEKVVAPSACAAIVATYPLTGDQLPFKNRTIEICRLAEFRIALLGKSCDELNFARQTSVD